MDHLNRNEALYCRQSITQAFGFTLPVFGPKSDFKRFTVVGGSWSIDDNRARSGHGDEMVGNERNSYCIQELAAVWWLSQTVP